MTRFLLVYVSVAIALFAFLLISFTPYMEGFY